MTLVSLLTWDFPIIAIILQVQVHLEEAFVFVGVPRAKLTCRCCEHSTHGIVEDPLEFITQSNFNRQEVNTRKSPGDRIIPRKNVAHSACETSQNAQKPPANRLSPGLGCPA
jgi:hypothetical protein